MNVADRLHALSQEWERVTASDEGLPLTPEQLAERERKARVVEQVQDLISTPDFFSLRAPVHLNSNGFERFELAGRGRRWPQIRLHRWHGSKGRDIHEHPWTALSFVLRGEVQNMQFDLVEGATHQVLVHWTRRDGEFELFDAGWCACFGMTSTRVPAGDSYGFAPGDFHDATATSGTVTVLLRSAYLREFSRIVRAKTVP